MSIILDKNTRAVVQGITGNEGRFHTAAMLRYGTRIVAGVTPGKGGQEVEGVPVYNAMAEAVSQHEVNASIIFVPARSAQSAAFEAIEAGVKTIVIITEMIPQKDAIVLVNRADKNSVTIVGPNTAGIINTGNKVLLGIMPTHIFKPGPIGMISRSGTLTYEVAWHISNSSLGQSTCVGLGGDSIVGLDFVRVLEMFKNDEETKGVVLIGEIGGAAEEEAAHYIRKTNYPKPIVSYIVGRAAPPEKRMGHAGAIVMGNFGTAKSKIDAFIAAGVPVAEKPGDIPELLKSKMS